MDLIRRVVIFLGITIIAIVVTYFVAFNDFEKETLPILSPRDINPELVDSSLHNRGIGTEGIYHQISPFNLVDQHGLEVSQNICLLYTSPSPRDLKLSRMPSSA